MRTFNRIYAGVVVLAVVGMNVGYVAQNDTVSWPFVALTITLAISAWYFRPDPTF